MNWEAIGALGEIVGAFAVVLSLLYVAMQIRSQNRESRIAAVHELNESFRGALTSFQNPNLADLFVRGKDDFESLPEAERVQFISMVQGVLRVWEDAFNQHQQKRLSEAQWQGMVAQYSIYLSLPGVVKVWSMRKIAYSEAFRAFVDSTTPTEYRSK